MRFSPHWWLTVFRLGRDFRSRPRRDARPRALSHRCVDSQQAADLRHRTTRATVDPTARTSNKTAKPRVSHRDQRSLSTALNFVRLTRCSKLDCARMLVPMTRSKPCCVLPSSNSAIPAAQQISVATTNTDCPVGARAAARSRPMIRWRVVPLSPFGDSGLCLGRATASRLIIPRVSHRGRTRRPGLVFPQWRHGQPHARPAGRGAARVASVGWDARELVGRLARTLRG